MPTREELERALDVVLKMDDYGAFLRDEREAIQLLRDCVPVPREELDRLERAVWRWMSDYYPHVPNPCSDFEEAGLISVDPDGPGMGWTPAAHELAERIKKG